jgi:hypothetical protein
MKYAILAIGAMLALSACASGNALPNVGPRPMDGIGPGGTDFGYWYRDGDGSVDQAFRAHITRRFDFADKERARTELTRDNFNCADIPASASQQAGGMRCTRVYYINDFYHTWSVEFLPQLNEPRVRYTRTATRNPLSNTGGRRREGGLPPAQ